MNYRRNDMKLLVISLCLMNLLGLLMMFYDKRRAVRQKRRVPERTLLTLAALGASPGVWAGMYLFHHKTKKAKFFAGVPLILAAQLALGAGLFLLFHK